MRFSFSLKGRDWFGLYLVGLIFYMGPNLGVQVLSRQIKHTPDPVKGLSILLLTLIMLMTLFLLIIPVYRKFINAISLDDTPLAFKGGIADYVLLNLIHGFLSVITLGIYAPWYFKRMLQYWAGQASYKDRSFRFMGRGAPLLVIGLLGLGIPVVIWALLLNAFVADQGGIGAMVMTAFLYVLLVPFAFFCYKWMIDHAWGEYRITWDVSPSEGILLILRELVLSIITVGIYAPAAMAVLYDAFVGWTVIRKDGRDVYRLKATVGRLEAWEVIWVNGLLSLLTLGIYGAWGYCNVFRVFMESTELVAVEEEGVSGGGNGGMQLTQGEGA